MKTLIVFYSYGGNTRKIAQSLQQETNGDIAEIETITPYTGDYNSVVDQGQQEVDSGYMPGIKPLSADITAYGCNRSAGRRRKPVLLPLRSQDGGVVYVHSVSRGIMGIVTRLVQIGFFRFC